MGCIKLNNEYEGKIIKMSNTVNNSNTNNVSEPEKANNYIVPKWAVNIVVTVVIACAGYALTVANKISDQVYELNAKASSNETLINELKEDIEIINKEIDTLDGRIDTLGSETVSHLYASEEFMDQIVSIEDVEVPTVTFSSDLIVGTNDEGKSYSAKKLVNEPLLLSYTEGENIIYFLGQFNENYQWDGYCVLNEYDNNGKIVGICESNFNDGSRIDYKTVCYINANEWDYYNRTCKETINSGESITYFFEYDDVAGFTNETIEFSDILNADEFISSQDAKIIKYYYGNTSGRLFNDTTGTAYFVKYSDEGYVRTLYCGNFVEGKFDDSTGNAWYIVKEADTNYMYYKGNFKKGATVNNKGSVFENPVSIERILEIIQDKEFNCSLEWEE